MGLVELSNGHVAASHSNPNCIYIVDTYRYESVVMFEDEKYIPRSGPLYNFGNNSFIYVSLEGGYFCQVTPTNDKYYIYYISKENDNDLYGACVYTLNNGKYIISSNKHKGCSIFRCSY